MKNIEKWRFSIAMLVYQRVFSPPHSGNLPKLLNKIGQKGMTALTVSHISMIFNGKAYVSTMSDRGNPPKIDKIEMGS